MNKKNYIFNRLRGITVMLALAAAFAAMPATLLAQTTINVSDATPAASGDGWTYASNVYTIDGTHNVTITGATTTRRVVVSGNASITLEDVDIQITSGGAPIDCGANTVYFTLVGDNILRTTVTGFAALQANSGHIIINGTDDDSLIATVAYGVAGNSGAGIGGGNSSSSSVTINGGKVTATGGSGNSGAGIGGGHHAHGTVIINGGIVTATGGLYTWGGAGIGGGNLDGITGLSTVVINGGTVTATGGGSATGLGGGYGVGNKATVTITGGTVTAIGPERAISENYTVPDGVSYWVATNTTNTTGQANGVSDGSFVIGSTHKYAKIDINNIIDLAEAVPTGGTGWTYASNVYTIYGTYPVKIINATTTRRVVITGNADITLDGVDIQLSAAINGGGAPIDCGANTVTFTLVGANVLKTTVNNYAGLQASNGHIIINGSDTDSLTATGYGNNGVSGVGGAGIGGGQGGAGTVTINGGVITATGGYGGTGIGAGNNGFGTVTINGGTITATGGGWSTGIGGSDPGGIVTINGGTVTAIGNISPCIGGGYAGNATVEINGGTVMANVIGRRMGGGATATITITGGSVKATLSDTPTNGTNPVYLNTLTVGSSANANAAVTAGSINGVAMEAVAPPVTGYGIKDVKTDAAGIVYFYLPASGSGGTASEVVSVTAGGTAYSDDYARGTTANTKTLTIPSTSTIIDVSNTSIAIGAGWTYSAGVFTVTGANPVTITGTTTTSRVVVTGNADVTLDGVDIQLSAAINGGGAPIDCGTNTVNFTLVGTNVLKTTVSNYAGLQANDGHIIIDGTGSLNATGAAYGAGIGGGQNGSATVTIQNGTVTANNGFPFYSQGGAGIGGGHNGNGTVTITGGTVEASATGTYGAGIGGGADGIATVTINGGVVIANGGSGAGIGGGGGNGTGFGIGTVIINDGTVTATSSGGAGIGGGYYSTGNVTINGGNIIADNGSGTYLGAGIGGGYNNATGTVTINGGTVSATGNNGTYSPVVAISGSIVIKGGSVKVKSNASSAFSSTPTNGATPVFLNTLTVGSAANADMVVTTGSINGVTMEAVAPPVTGYGIKDVKTDAAGIVYFYLPASGSGGTASEVVSVTVGGTAYSDDYTRGTTANTKTLSLPFTYPTATSVSANASAPRVGTALTGSYTYNAGTGTGAGTESGTTVQWYRSDAATWGSATSISGATGATYTPTGADVGKYLFFEVTPSNGTLTGTAVQSAASGQAGIVVSLSVTTNGTTGSATLDGGAADVTVYSTTAPTAAATLGDAASVAWTTSTGGGSFTNAASITPGYALPTLNESITGPITLTATFTAAAPPVPSATVGNVSVSGVTNTALTSQTATITLSDETFYAIVAGTDVASWFSNIPAGMTAVSSAVSVGATSVTITFGGTPTATSTAAMAISIPSAHLQTSTSDLAVTPNTSAVFTISSAPPTPPTPPTPPISPASYTVNIGTYPGGSITANRTTAAAGDIVTLTAAPEPGYEIDAITAHRTSSSETTVSLSGTGNTRKFTMPAYHVTVEATFAKTAQQTLWEKARTIIENAAYNVPRQYAGTPEELAGYLAGHINGLLASAGVNLTLTAADIWIESGSFTPATANTNGSFAFFALPAGVIGSNLNNGVIIAGTVGVETQCIASLQVYVLNSVLYVRDLPAGVVWRVYNIAGTLIYQGVATDVETQCFASLPSRGIYLVTDGKTTVKVVN